MPVVVPDYIDAEDVLSAMTRDKKISKGRLRFALLSRIGDVAMHNDVPVDVAREAVMRSYAIA